MAGTHLLSLHPIHAQAMLDGIKTIEWRRRWPTIIEPDDRLVIYATSPTSALIGEVTVSQVHRGTPNDLWREHHVAGCVDQDLFNAYMGSVNTAVAVQVSHARRWPQPVGLDDLKALQDHRFHPPQTTARIDPVKVERLYHWGRWNALGQGRCAWSQNRFTQQELSVEDLAWMKHRAEDAPSLTWWDIVNTPERTAPFKRFDETLSDPAAEYTPMVLHINQPGPLDEHGRPARRRAGFMVLKSPGFPHHYDENEEVIGEKAIVAWFLEPWAEALGWRQHMLAVAMKTLSTLKPVVLFQAAELDQHRSWISAMKWTWREQPGGHVQVNDGAAPYEPTSTPLEQQLRPVKPNRRA